MVELLAPAGSMDALKAAIAAGADAIYVGGSRFNARAYATNFDINELEEAVKLCHLHNVRLFVTVNTLYKESEITDLYDYLCDLYRIQVDALIVQDEGIMRFISDHFENFEVHASTQCSVHNKEGVKHYQNLGLKRVVVARENSLDEIKEMVATGCEIEAFVHGALCVSYSGQCYMSQLIGKRSANRGMCAQPCRLPYRLYKEDQLLSDTSYLLSCKDLCTIDHIDQLIEAGICSFKIEGRMKRPEYVYAITNAYRRAIDNHQKGDLGVLKQLFNRDFTSGYLFDENQIVSPVFSGNRGVYVGEVVHYDQKLKKLHIQTSMTIHQGDGIRIGFKDEGKILNKIYQKGKLVNQVDENQRFEMDYDHFIKKGTAIYRTTDITLEKTIDKALCTFYRKHPISMKLVGKVDSYATLTCNDGVFEVSVQSKNPLEASQKPTDIERLKQQLSKLGQTIYEVSDIEMNLSNDCFIPISELNEMRRLACEQMDECRKTKKVRHRQSVLPLTVCESRKKELKNTYIHCHSYKQVKAVGKIYEEESIYMDFSEDFLKAKEEFPYLGLVIPTICNEAIFQKCDAILKCYPDLSVAVNNVGAYERYQKNVTLLLPGMNLSHQYALDAYKQPTVISIDMDLNDEKATSDKQCEFIKMTYGHIDAMTTKYCPLSYSMFGKKVEGCKQCLKGNYFMEDRMNTKFPMIFENNCVVHLLSHQAIKRKPATHQYLRFTIENEAIIKEMIRKYRNH